MSPIFLPGAKSFLGIWFTSNDSSLLLFKGVQLSFLYNLCFLLSGVLFETVKYTFTLMCNAQLTAFWFNFLACQPIRSAESDPVRIKIKQRINFCRRIKFLYRSYAQCSRRFLELFSRSEWTKRKNKSGVVRHQWRCSGLWWGLWRTNR